MWPVLAPVLSFIDGPSKLGRPPAGLASQRGCLLKGLVSTYVLGPQEDTRHEIRPREALFWKCLLRGLEEKKKKNQTDGLTQPALG